MPRRATVTTMLPVLLWSTAAGAQPASPGPADEPTEDERPAAMLDRASDCAGAGRRDEAIALVSRIVDEHRQSAAARQALLILADHLLAVGEHERAAERYARFAELYPADEPAPEAARTAIELDLALGRLDRAVEGAERFELHHGRTLEMETARVSASIGRALERRGDRRALLAHDRRWLRVWADHAPVALRLHVEARMARALAASGDDRAALEAHRRVVALWDGPAGNALRGTPDDARVRSDVAASLLALADAERGAAEAQPFPTLRGRHIGAQKIGEWARAHLMPWIEARMDGLARAARAYQRVAEPGPTVHQIAAATSVGEMWIELGAAFEQAPTPAELQADPRLLQVYRDALEHQTRPLEQRGIAALEHAVALATTHRLFGPEARRAIERLRAADPALAAGDELLGAPVLPRAGVLPRGVLDGPPDHAACPGQAPVDDAVEDDTAVEPDAAGSG